eukprot:4281381-Amphidinium_carterae.1
METGDLANSSASLDDAHAAPGGALSSFKDTLLQRQRDVRSRYASMVDSATHTMESSEPCQRQSGRSGWQSLQPAFSACCSRVPASSVGPSNAVCCQTLRCEPRPSTWPEGRPDGAEARPLDEPSQPQALCQGRSTCRAVGQAEQRCASVAAESALMAYF